MRPSETEMLKLLKKITFSFFDSPHLSFQIEFDFCLYLLLHLDFLYECCVMRTQNWLPVSGCCSPHKSLLEIILHSKNAIILSVRNLLAIH